MQRMPLNARSPVVVFANALGDHLLALPTLRALAQLFPGRLRLLGLADGADTFFQDIEFQAVLPLKVTGVLPGQGIEFDVDHAREAIGDCDLFLSLVPWHTESLDQLLNRLHPVRSVGFFPGFSEVLPLRYDKHSSDLAFDLPRHFDASLAIESFCAPPVLPPLDRIRALTAGCRILVIHADTQPAKMWRWESFVRVLRRFFEAHKEFVGLLIGMPHPAVEPAALKEHLAPCLGLAIPETLAITGMADLFLGVDSCFLHAADLFRVPGVALFGPTNADEFGFRFSPHQHICGSGSMDSIAEDEVVAALDELANAR